MYRDYVKPVLGEMTMAEIGKPDVGRVMTRMVHMNRSAQLRKHVYAMMRSMFGAAIEYYEMLTVSPVVSKFHRPKVKAERREFLTLVEVAKLLEVAKNHYMGPAIWLEALSALRNSEAQALRWKHVRFDLNQILICAAFNKKIRVMQNFPKQGDWAKAPMTPLLADYLLARRGDDEELVCKGVSGGVLPYETFTRGLTRMCRQAGVKEITPHELRHTCAHIFSEEGASDDDLRGLLNHSSMSAVKTYIHRTDARLARLSGSVSGALRVIQGGAASEAWVTEKPDLGNCAGNLVRVPGSRTP
jgi:integrase